VKTTSRRLKPQSPPSEINFNFFFRIARTTHSYSQAWRALATFFRVGAWSLPPISSHFFLCIINLPFISWFLLIVFIYDEFSLPSNFLLCSPAQQPSYSLTWKHQSLFRTYSFFLIFSLNIYLSPYLHFWTWLYCTTMFLQKLYTIKPENVS
jgi:hypothetical protein